jgi:DNA invertase Pin-like site-specific DNA recombinase
VNRIGKNKSEMMRRKGLETRRRNREEKKAEFESMYLPGMITIDEVSKACGISIRTGKQFWKEIKAERMGGFIPCI